MKLDVYSMGFSNRTWEETIAILSGSKIRRLADIRTLPGSRHTPQFNLEHLQVALPRAGIEYVHLKALGGLRKPRKDSAVNAAWRNEAFRGYADYMQTQEFEAALKKLIDVIQYGTDCMKLIFLGATQTVTGSKFLIETNDRRILVDCGLFQGLKELRLRNWEAPPVDPKSIDAVVLTHAHIDHTGYLPRFVAQGYKGPVYATSATVDLARILLPDAGHLQEEEANYRNKHHLTKHKPALPLYTVNDAMASLELLRPVKYGEVVSLSSSLGFDMMHAGHILGSSFVRFSEGSGGTQKTVLFTGDIGRYDQPIIFDPASVDAADYLILESTYGNRLHAGKQGTSGKDQLRDVVVSTAKRGGTVLIPSFAIGRAQELLYILRELEVENKIPVLPVYVDSPMAVDAVDIFRKHVEEHDLEMAQLEKDGGNPLYTQRVHFARSVEESKAINEHRFPSIIISANGMATGGRILHHLMQRLPD